MTPHTPYQYLISLLLCCLPCLALLYFKPQLHLGVIRIMGNHYNLTPFSRHQQQTSHLPQDRLPTHRKIERVRAFSGKTDADMQLLIFSKSDQQMKVKAMHLTDDSILPPRRLEELRRTVRKNTKSRLFSFFDAPQDDIPIVKLLPN